MIVAVLYQTRVLLDLDGCSISYLCHPNQEGDTLLKLVALIGLWAESVYGGDIRSIITDH